jgi:hypothetical protein
MTTTRTFTVTLTVEDDVDPEFVLIETLKEAEDPMDEDMPVVLHFDVTVQ